MTEEEIGHAIIGAAVGLGLLVRIVNGLLMLRDLCEFFAPFALKR